MLRDEHAELAEAGLTVFGVSPQDPSSHARFKAENALPFELLSDPDKAAIKGYGANGPLGMGVRRVSYLVIDGRIRSSLRADLNVERHREFAREARIVILGLAQK